MSLNKFQFNHLKIHTQYSICEGALKIADLSSYCKSHNINSVGISDSFNMCGVLEFSEEISKVGTQPIIGTQINFSFSHNNLEKIGKISLIAKNITGYKNLLKLSSNSYLSIEKNHEPHCAIEELINHSEGLIVLLGGSHSLISSLILNSNISECEFLINKIIMSYKNNAYIEIQRHGEAHEPELEARLLNLSTKLNIPLLATHEVYYLNQDIHEAHDAYICVGQKTYVSDTKRLRYSDQHYLKNDTEMSELFTDLPEALENNKNISYRCSYRPLTNKPMLPNFNTESSNVNDELKLQAKIGLEKKLKDFILINIEDQNEKKLLTIKYEERLNYEVEMISKMKFSGYFLIVSDYIKWAKTNNIPVGPGRGSGAGSLVAWCLSITDLDPIKFGLIFERFLNPDRISMPDFDIDFCQEDRDKVINYVKDKYKNKVAQIITFGKLQARMALRDIGRVIGLPYGRVDQLSKMIPFDPSRPLSLAESVAIEPRIQEAQKEDPAIDKLVKLALKLEGLYRNIATHAAGIVIGDKDLTEIIPLYKDHDSTIPIPVTQFDMKWAEEAGLVKFDFLGLKTLTVIKKTIKLIKEEGTLLDIEKIPLDDSKTFELLSSGETMGIFQLESSGMREVLKQMRPNKFEDIIALVALYRPGPMQNISTYNNRKHGSENPDYLHPKIENILKETYGVIIYQEQVMQIAQALSGFSAGKADILRKAMGKKKSAEMERQKKDFIEGAVSNNIPKDQAIYIFQLVEKFAQYGFNKSHAAAYALIAYQTAYLKTHFPLSFFSASMSMDMSNTDKLNQFYEELKRLSIKIHNPCINNCYADFIPKNNTIYYALSAIKAVGYEAISNVIKEREENGKFKSIEDFVKRVHSKNVNKLQLEGLIKAGAFDCLDNNRSKIYNNVPELIKQSKNYDENSEVNQINLFDSQTNQEFLINFEDYPAWNEQEKIKREFESIGFFVSDHPLKNYKQVLESYNVINYQNFVENAGVSECMLSGTVMAIQEKKTAKGMPFAIVKFSDLSRMFEFFIFSEVLISNREKLIPGKSFLISVKREMLKTGIERTNVSRIFLIDDIKEKNIRKLNIQIKESDNLEILKKEIIKEGKTSVSLNYIQNGRNFIFKFKNEKNLNLESLKSLENHGFLTKIIN
jgi:DNA polymerase-3 subunit alpha